MYNLPIQGPTGTNPRTVEAWINMTQIVLTQIVIVDWGDIALGHRFTLNIINGVPRIEIGGSGLNATTSITQGTWHHIAVTFDNSATNKYKLYINGNISVSGNLATSIATGNTNGIIIGRRMDAAKYFIGKIDEVRVWNYARSQTEIQNSMNSEICPVSGLVSYYNFNQGVASSNNSTVTTLYDNSGNSNNGILNNFSLNGSISNWVSGKSLTPNASSTSSISITVCDSYTSPSANYTWTASGTYFDTIQNSGGCDSIITISLTINTADTAVVQNGNTLTANAIGASYKWLDCNNGYTAIIGATNQSFTPATNGSYAVEITQNGCVDTSACYHVTSVSITDDFVKSGISIYPNPVIDHFFIEFDPGSPEANLEIINLAGQLIYKQTFFNTDNIEVNLSFLEEGFYILKIYNAELVNSFKLIKK